jgi:hypothetical protein
LGAWVTVGLRGDLLRVPKFDLCAAGHQLFILDEEAGQTMTQSVANARTAGGTVFGFPLEGFGLFTSLLLAFAAAFFTFFATTCIAIFALLAWNLIGHHKVNYADSYLYVGFPAGVLVLVVALPVFGAVGAGQAAQVDSKRRAIDVDPEFFVEGIAIHECPWPEAKGRIFGKS